MTHSPRRRAWRLAGLGLMAGLGALALHPAAAQAQGYRGGDYGYGYGYYRDGGYGPRYGAVSGYYPGGYYIPQPYAPGPRVVYVQPPRVRYAAPVRRVVQHTPIHRATVAACTCGLPRTHAALPRTVTPAALPVPHPPIATPTPAAPVATPAARPPVVAPAPSVPPDTFEPRPSIGD